MRRNCVSALATPLSIRGGLGMLMRRQSANPLSWSGNGVRSWAHCLYEQIPLLTATTSDCYRASSRINKSNGLQAPSSPQKPPGNPIIEATSSNLQQAPAGTCRGTHAHRPDTEASDGAPTSAVAVLTSAALDSVASTSGLSGECASSRLALASALAKSRRRNSSSACFSLASMSFSSLLSFLPCPLPLPLPLAVSSLAPLSLLSPLAPCAPLPWPLSLPLPLPLSVLLALPLPLPLPLPSAQSCEGAEVQNKL